MKYWYKGMVFLVLTLLVIVFCNREVKAEENSNNVSVTVSSQVSIVFREDGTNSVSDFVIANDSAVPIHVTNVAVTMHNGWELVSGEKEISVDKKQLAFSFQGQYLMAGDNFLQLTIPEQQEQRPSISIRRGAFSKACESQKAMELSIEYALGQKGFHLTFEGTEEAIEQVTVFNGERIKLPTPERMKYNFLGWEDMEGNVYQEEFLMPMYDVVLSAKWQWTDAYAFYTDADKTLRFVRSVEPIEVGDYWDGKVIDAVYTGVEEKNFIIYQRPPWIGYTKMKRVEILDWIQPKITAYWFFCMYEVEYLDLRKLEVSQVVDMAAMFSGTGLYVTEKVTALGLEDWNVSSVKYFGSIFRQFGRDAKVVEMGDLSGWDTSSAVDMRQMFLASFQVADVYVDCSQWNVDLVTDRRQFKDSAGGTIIEPIWKS